VATVTVDSTSQRYTSATQPEPDILLLHTTEGMSWPGYALGKQAPHDTVKAIPGKGIEVRRHYPYDQYSRSLENDAGGVETNRRGVIQIELRGTCDPKHRNDPAWYFWPDADDAVLSALADYYRPLMAKYGIPARAMHEFLAYPASYGNSPARLTFAEWTNGSGIAGHSGAPENAHGDPGAFPIDRFIQFLKQEDDMPTMDEMRAVFLTKADGAQLRKDIGYARDQVLASGDPAKLAAALAPAVASLLPAGSATITDAQLETALRKVLGSVDGAVA